MTKKTGNPAQKSSQAKANPSSSSAASNGGGSKAPASKGDNASGGGRSDGGSSGGSCQVPGNSFVPGTRVLMADGTSKPIEDVKTGDIVQATEAETGETQTKTVTATITGHGIKHLVKIVIDTDGEHGTASAAVTATDGHPFWAPELGQWLDATDLQPGQWLQTSAGTWIQITAINRWTIPSATVHNLTISDIHTYCVAVGGSSVLVHNCNDAVQRELADMRAQMGMQSTAQEDAARAMAAAAGVPKSKLPKANTLAKLDYGDGPYYGMNGRVVGRAAEFPGKGHRMTATSFEDHAEGDVFAQAAAGGARGGHANLYIDRNPCTFCRNSMAGYAEMLGLDSLDVYGPGGLVGRYTRESGRYVRQ